MADYDPSVSLRLLQPVCVRLSKEPTRSNIKDLSTALLEVTKDHLSQLFDYIFFPLKLAMKHPTGSNELKQAAIECTELLVARAGINNLPRFEEMYTFLCMLLNDEDRQRGHIADLSEELKLAIISCLNCVLDSTAVVLKASLYSTKFLPALGHAVWLFLALAEHEKARSLRVNAITCVRKLAFCAEAVQGAAKEDDVKEELAAGVRSSAAVAFASFIPGISSTLCRIITKDSKQGHGVLRAALDLWGDVVSLVMNDKQFPRQESNDADMISQLAGLVVKNDSQGTKGSESKDIKSAGRLRSDVKTGHNKDKQQQQQKQTTTNNKVNGLRVQVTQEWLMDTAERLKYLFKRLDTVASHSNWRVRLCLVELADKLLVSCAVSVEPCVPVLVDLLVGLMRDEFPQVSSRSKSVLKEFSLNKIQSGSSSLRSLCEENVHTLLSSLPRLIMRTADDSKKLQTLNLVVGYLSLLGRSVCVLLNSAALLKRLSLALIQILEFDLSDVGIVEEKTSSVTESAVLSSDTKGENPLSFPAAQFVASKYPKYRFKHFTDEKIHSALSELCCLLGYYGNLPLLVDHFVDLFHESQTQQKQAVFILNQIVRGHLGQGIDECIGILRDDMKKESASTEGHPELTGTVELLLTEYTADVNWNRPTSNQLDMQSPPETHSTQDLTIIKQKEISRATKGLPFEVLNSNVQLSCLFLEGIGIFSQVLGDKFETFLISTLYPVMSKLGDDNATVSRSAYGTLLQICQSCGYVSIDELIARNADYLVNAISLNFKYVFVNQQAPCVLRVMVQYSSGSILSIIDDTLMDIFAVIDTYPHDKLMYSLIKVLNVLVCSVKRWFPASRKTDDHQVEVSESKEGLTCPIPDTELEESERGEQKASPEDIRQFFLDYHKRKQMALGELEPPGEEHAEELQEGQPQGDDVGDDGVTFEADKAPEVPLHVKYVTQVLEKCIHFLPSKSPWLRLLVLDTVQNGVQALADTQDQLLPMIHRLWPAMVKRFTDEEQIVTIKAVKVLCTMAEASGDFMRRRVLKDVVPLLTAFLDKQAPVSIKAGPAYLHTHACHLQVAVLDGLGHLCRQLEIGEIDLNHVASTCAQYLSCRQPRQLQQAAVQAFEKFIRLEADHMWLVLNDLYCPNELKPPHLMFKAVQLGGVGPENEYSENVKVLLSTL